MAPTTIWVAGGLLALGLVLSGCVTNDASTTEGTGSPGAEPVVTPRFDANTGSIVGQVLTFELLPVPSASVGIVGLDVESQSDESGRFALNNLPPGEHVVQASAPGFVGGTRAVQVTAGAVTADIVLVLQSLPSTAPYHRTDIRRVALTGLMWKVTPECVYTTINPLVKTCGGIRFLCGDPDQCEIHYGNITDFTDEWETVIGEVTWRPQSGLTGRGFHFDINAPNITRGPGGSINQADPYTFDKASNAPPIVTRVDKAQLAGTPIKADDWNNYPDNDCTAPDPDDTGNCDWFWRLFPAACHLGNCPTGYGPDYGLSYENPVEVYFSYFIRAPAPADFTALEAR